MSSRLSRQCARPFVVRFGGGVNSLALLLGLYDRGEVPALVCFSDTGGEAPETYEALARADTWLHEKSWPRLTVVQHVMQDGTATLENACLRNDTLPSRAFGWSSCAQKWKLDPFNKFLTSWPAAKEEWASGRKLRVMLGYDAGEERRATITEDKRCVYEYPLMAWGWSRRRCVERIEAAGLPVPPKSSCFFCPSMKKHEVLSLSRNHPELFRRAVEMERRAAPNNTDVKGLGRNWSWESLVKMNEAQLSLLPDQPVEACITCTEDGCEADDE